jgi:hypothetical protein
MRKVSENYYRNIMHFVLAALYILAIFVFAIAYWYLPFNGCSGLEFPDAVYFSAVTITTLGYGDISPVNSAVKYIAAFEAVFGVFILGAFLLNFANYQARRTEEGRVAIQKDNLIRSYQFFRQQVMTIFVRGLCESNHIELTKISERVRLAETLYDFENYIEYFDGNNEAAMEALRNAVNTINGLAEDLYLETDLFHEQLNLALLTVPHKNETGMQWLSAFSRDIARIRRSENTKSDPGGHFLNHLDDIMRNSGSQPSVSNSDIFEGHVHEY